MTFIPSSFPTVTPRMLPIKHLSLVPKAVPSPGEPREITLLAVVMLVPASRANGDVSGTRGGVGKRVLAHGCIAAAGNVDRRLPWPTTVLVVADECFERERLR